MLDVVSAGTIHRTPFLPPSLPLTMTPDATRTPSLAAATAATAATAAAVGVVEEAVDCALRPVVNMPVVAHNNLERKVFQRPASLQSVQCPEE